LLLCSSYLPLGFPNCLAIIIIINYKPSSPFLAPLPGKK
jgi:hypothetical protein